jgi:hypothetical protein
VGGVCARVILRAKKKTGIQKEKKRKKGLSGDALYNNELFCKGSLSGSTGMYNI